MKRRMAQRFFNRWTRRCGFEPAPLLTAITCGGGKASLWLNQIEQLAPYQTKFPDHMAALAEAIEKRTARWWMSAFRGKPDISSCAAHVCC